MHDLQLPLLTIGCHVQQWVSEWVVVQKAPEPSFSFIRFSFVYVCSYVVTVG